MVSTLYADVYCDLYIMHALLSPARHEHSDNTRVSTPIHINNLYILAYRLRNVLRPFVLYSGGGAFFHTLCNMPTR